MVENLRFSKIKSEGVEPLEYVPISNIFFLRRVLVGWFHRFYFLGRPYDLDPNRFCC